MVEKCEWWDSPVMRPQSNPDAEQPQAWSWWVGLVTSYPHNDSGLPVCPCRPIFSEFSARTSQTPTAHHALNPISSRQVTALRQVAQPLGNAASVPLPRLFCLHPPRPGQLAASVPGTHPGTAWGSPGRGLPLEGQSRGPPGEGGRGESQPFISKAI